MAGGADLTLVAADYSQIELRILAHVSGDEHLRDAFARKADLHRETAALVLHKDPADVTLGERSMAKMVNFGIAYGLSDFGLSERANIPRAEAQAFINTYFATYSGISYYMLAIKEQARTQGFVTTLLGRKRQIPELAARNPTLRAAGERMAINMPIQGTAADIVKIAMIRLDERLRAGGFRARPLLQVHDELLLEVPRDEVDRLVPILRETMEGALPLDVPLTVDIKVGDDWESMTPLTRADAIAAEADEAPDLEAPVAPVARVGRVDARASRGRDGRARPAPAHPRRDDRRRPDARGRGPCARTRPRRSPRRSPAGGSRRVGRRAKQIVVELSGDAALTIHLKMTGQLFVVPAETPEDPYVRLVLELADGRELRFRDIRKFGEDRAVRARPGDRRARRPRSAAARSSRRSVRSRSTRRSRCATSGAGCGAGRAGSSRSCSTSRSWPASATSTPTRRCGRRGCIRCGRPGRCARPTSATSTTRSGGSSPRPSSGAAARSTTTPRPTATARCRSACRSTSGPASRVRAAAGRSSGSSSARDRRTSARGASGCRRARSQGRRGDPADDDRRAAPGRAALDRAGGRGERSALTPDEAARASSARHGPSARSGPPRRAGRRRARRRARRRRGTPRR